MASLFQTWCMIFCLGTALVSGLDAWSSYDQSSETLCSSACTGDYDHEKHTCDGGMARRLSPAIRMNVDQLLDVLQDFEMQGLKFSGMIYQGRRVDFDYFLGGTPVHFFVPVLDKLADMAAPFYHHLLLFPLDLNGTVPGEEMHSHLLIHFQRDGVKGRFVTRAAVSPTEDLHSYTFVGSVEPSWITAALQAVGKLPFSTPQWNCHHFAVHLFEDLARACAASGRFNCPPEHVKGAFPSTISPTWCLPCQAIAVTGLAIGLVVMMVGLSHKLFKRMQSMQADQQSKRSKTQDKVPAEMFE